MAGQRKQHGGPRRTRRQAAGKSKGVPLPVVAVEPVAELTVEPVVDDVPVVRPVGFWRRLVRSMTAAVGSFA